MKGRLSGIIAVALRLILAGVFLYAGMQKLGTPQTLADTIAAYQLPLGWLTNPLALVLPPLEIIAAAGLFFATWRRASLLLLGALTVVFLMALIQASARGLVVDCGCFGSGQPSTGGMMRAILRDVAMLGAVAWLYWREISNTGENS